MPRRWQIRLGVLAALLWLSFASRDPDLYPPGEASVPVIVVDHGYHSGLVVRTGDLRGIAAALRAQRPDLARLLLSFPAHWAEADWLEFGWGDAAFYQATRTTADIQIRLTIPALLWPTASAIQVVPGHGDLETAFPDSDRLPLRLSPGGWRRLAVRLAESVAPGPSALPEPIGPSLYGAGLFFRSSLSYHAGRTCNQWVSGLLRVEDS